MKVPYNRYVLAEADAYVEKYKKVILQASNIWVDPKTAHHKAMRIL